MLPLCSIIEGYTTRYWKVMATKNGTINFYDRSVFYLSYSQFSSQVSDSFQVYSQNAITISKSFCQARASIRDVEFSTRSKTFWEICTEGMFVLIMRKSEEVVLKSTDRFLGDVKRLTRRWESGFNNRQVFTTGPIHIRPRLLFCSFHEAFFQRQMRRRHVFMATRTLMLIRTIPHPAVIFHRQSTSPAKRAKV